MSSTYTFDKADNRTSKAVSGAIGPAPSANPSLGSGQSVNAGQQVKSADGRFRLVQQADGNLVIYGPRNVFIWASHTQAFPGSRTAMQGDGNLVVYDSSDIPRWAAGTNGHPGATLKLDGCGRATIYSASGQRLWRQSKPSLDPEALYPQMAANEQLTSGQSVSSADGRFSLHQQSDGNLVLYGPASEPVWAAGTYGYPGARAVLQEDGNLVVYDQSNVARWDSGTYGNPGAELTVRSNGNLTLSLLTGRQLWMSATCCR